MKKAGWILLALAMSLGACAPNNVKIEQDWEKYFTKYKAEGTFMLFDNSQGQFQVYNIDRARQQFLPAQTFDIFNTLTGFQQGILRDSSTRLGPDNLPLQQAFKQSNAAFFKALSDSIGTKHMTAWMDSVKYGNMKMTTDTFWTNNSLLISPDEELGFTKKLYFDNLSFNKTAMEAVRNLMAQEGNDKYALSYKTGAGKLGKKNIGWVTGWIEENKHPTFFVLNIESEDPNFDMDHIPVVVTKQILTDAGFFQGEK